MRNFIRKLYFYFLSFLNLLLPKKKNKIFFEDLSGIKDNHYVLFSYLESLPKSKELDIIYFSKEPQLLRERFGNNVFFTSNTFIATYHYLTSRVIFFAFGMNRFQCIPRKNQFVVNLWHGMPLKKIGYSIGESAAYRQELSYTNFLISSPFFADVIKEGCGCSDKQLVILGYPRNDLLFEKLSPEEMHNLLDGDYRKVITFLPTFRNSESLGISKHHKSFPLIDENNIEELNLFLKSIDVCLVIKLHHAQSNLSFTNERYSNLVFLSNADLDMAKIPLYSLLGTSDALLSDYSSVFVDYLIVNKPIGFVLDDLEDYRENRGLYFEPIEEYLPGHHIYNMNNLKAFINDVANEKDPFNKERNDICKLFNVYKDNCNCERVLKFTEII